VLRHHRRRTPESNGIWHEVCGVINGGGAYCISSVAAFRHATTYSWMAVIRNTSCIYGIDGIDGIYGTSGIYGIYGIDGIDGIYGISGIFNRLCIGAFDACISHWRLGGHRCVRVQSRAEWVARSCDPRQHMQQPSPREVGTWKQCRFTSHPEPTSIGCAERRMGLQYLQRQCLLASQPRRWMELQQEEEVEMPNLHRFFHVNASPRSSSPRRYVVVAALD
jgi:hypothetical protein